MASTVNSIEPADLHTQYIDALTDELATTERNLEDCRLAVLAFEDRVNRLRALRARHEAALALLAPAPEPEQPPATTATFDQVIEGTPA